MQHKTFLAALLNRGIKKQASVWAEALNMQFNVVVCCESDELAEIVHNVVKQESASHLLGPFIICQIKTAESTPQKTHVHPRDFVAAEPDVVVRPTLYICPNNVPSGLVAVRFDLPSMRALLPGVGAIVSQALEHMNLERYVDCFDGKTTSALKKILEARGITSLLDAIIQVAYLAGVMGDERQSHQYLAGVTTQTAWVDGEGCALMASPNLDQLFDSFMSTHDPYDTLKAALAHYAFVRKKVSQAEASRNLKVSRSTLQSHLSMAERLNVARFFSIGQLGT